MQITFELKEMSPTEKRVFWKRYVNSVRRVLFNIFAPCVCLTLLTWLIPTIGKPYWTLHASEPGAQTSALIWLALVAIGVIWQLYGLFAAVPFLFDSIRILRNAVFARIRASEMTKAQRTRQPRYRVFKGKGSQRPAFSTNWKFLAKAYVRYRCQNYGCIEKLVSGQYETILEMAYGIRPANN